MRENREATPRVTIVVVPREQYSVARRSLESIFEHTKLPHELIYVDGPSPAPLQRWLDAQARERGFRLLRSRRPLSPNHARNWALEFASTPYLVFVDNDLIVTPNWLETLVRCADETDAWAVGPLYLEGEPGDGIVHMAGGHYAFTGEAPERSFHTEHLLQKTPLAELPAPLERGDCAFVEFHCMLCRREVFETLGPLDSALLNSREHLDLCIAIEKAGGRVLFEPACLVTYKSPPPLDPGDRGFFWLRWSEDWTRRSLERFVEKHGIESGYLDRITIATARRAIAFDPFIRRVRAWCGGRVAETLRDFVMRAEATLNRLRFRGRSGALCPEDRERANS